jgi:hypothetical protein
LYSSALTGAANVTKQAIKTKTLQRIRMMTTPP